MSVFTKTFGIIAEGATDHRVLKNILVGFFNDPDLTQYIRFLQPSYDATDADYLGGWTRALAYVQSDDFKDAASELDFLVIAVDTDRLDEMPFGLNKLDENGRTAAPEVFVERTKARFAELIGEGIFEANKEKIIFGIAVNDIECWLLPLNLTGKDMAATTTCLGRLNDSLRKKNLPPVTKRKDPNQYDSLSKDFRKPKILFQSHPKNPSLRLFFEEIRAKTATTS